MISVFDGSLVALIYILVFLIIAISEYARSKFNLRATSTRHAIHLLAGDTMLLLPFFSSFYYPLTLPVGLALLLLFSFRSRKTDMMSKTMIDDEYDRFHVYGPLYYVISIGILVVFGWGMRHIAMAAVMIMAWGDGSASFLATFFKRRHLYPSSSKSLEGSLVMLIFSTLGAFLAMLISLQTGIISTSIVNTLILSLAGAITGTVVEACTIGPLKAFDNFTVPLSAAGVMYLMFLVLL